MYNLMVTGGDNLWEEGHYTWHRYRILEHTSPENKQRFSGFSPEDLNTLAEYPALLMYEDGTEGVPRIAKITRTMQRADEIKVYFDFTQKAPSVDQIKHLKWELEILDREFTRTHWAVKNADLFRILSGLILESTVDDALDTFKVDSTLEELVAAIQRDIRANKHGVSLDRLHTYCMKKFMHLLEQRGIACDRDEPLHSRVGKFVKVLEESTPLHDVSRRIAKSSIAVMEQFNHVRNNSTLAHDQDLLPAAEARFVFDGVIAFLRFIRTLQTLTN